MRPIFSHIPWLELLLLATLLSLAGQLVPELGVRLLAALDMRTWSRTAWFLANLAGGLPLWPRLGQRLGYLPRNEAASLATTAA